jgi:hypothetical protein
MPQRPDGPLHQIHDGAHRRRRADHAERHLFRRARVLRRRRKSGLLTCVCKQRFEIPRRRRTRQHVEDAGTDRLGRGRRTKRIGDANHHGVGLLVTNGAGQPDRFPVLSQVDEADRHRRSQPVHRFHAVYEERLVADGAKQSAELHLPVLAGHEQGGGRDTLCRERRGCHGVSRVKTPAPVASTST